MAFYLEKKKNPQVHGVVPRSIMTFFLTALLGTQVIPSIPNSFHLGCTNNAAVPLPSAFHAGPTDVPVAYTLTSFRFPFECYLDREILVNTQYDFPCSCMFVCFVLLEYTLYVTRDSVSFHCYIPKV